jgi:hypothetical protein
MRRTKVVRIELFYPPVTWRAPSSPHLACGLNGSSLLHCCTNLNMTKAGRCHDVRVRLKTCESLHRIGKSTRSLPQSRACPVHVCQESTDFQECYRKKVMLKNQGGETFESPAFIDFSGLRLKVIWGNKKGNAYLSD